MPNVVKVLKQEITRLARKEAKAATTDLKRDNVKLKRSVSALKKRMAGLEKKNRIVAVTLEKSRPPAVPDVAPEMKMRVSSRTITALRRRLKLSQVDFGRLVGVTGQTVYQWERKGGKLKLRKPAIRQALAEAKRMGAREARERLEGK